MDSKKQTLGMLAALVANAIFGFSFIFSKLALQVAHPLVILAVRFTFAFLALNLLLITGKIKINLKGKPLSKLILMGIAQPLLYFIFELYGLSMVSSALSGIIIAFVPVAVMLLAVAFLKDKPSPLQIFFTSLSIIGIALISILSNDGSKSYVLGVVLLIAAVICAAVFNLLSKKESQNFSVFERTYVMFLIATVGFNLLAFFVLKGNYLTHTLTALSNEKFLLSILYLSVLSSVTAFMLYNYSTAKISLIQSSSFSNIIPVVTVVAGVLILKESFNLLEYLLCFIIILGVWGVNIFARKK